MCDTCDNPPILERCNDPLVTIPAMHEDGAVRITDLPLSLLRDQYVASLGDGQLGAIEFLNLSVHRQDRITIAWARFNTGDVTLREQPRYGLVSVALLDLDDDTPTLPGRPGHA